MAERRIAERTGRVVVCFISNYSWLDGLSFTGMRERYLEAFDTIHIDNLHGDRIISEYAPDGRTSETVFALRGQSPGIKVGTSIVLLSSTEAAGGPSTAARIRYRDFHQARAEERRQALLDSLATDAASDSALVPDVRVACPSSRWLSATNSTTGRRFPICSRCRSPVSRRAATGFSWTSTSSGCARASATTSTRT